jgi:hypothetical protein
MGAFWYPRENVAEFVAEISFDAWTNGPAGIYSSSGSWPAACNVINWSVLFALKPGAGTPQFYQGNGNGTPTNGLTLASWDIAYTKPNLAGSCLIAFAIYDPDNDVGGSLKITDTNGNNWIIVYSQHIPFEQGHAICLVAPDCAAGINTLTLECTGVGVTIEDISVIIHEYPGVSLAAPTPVASPDTGGESATGLVDAIQVLAGGPAVNSFSGSITTLTANDMLVLFTGTDPHCAGYVNGPLIPPGGGGGAGGEFHGTYTSVFASGQIGGGTL